MASLSYDRGNPLISYPGEPRARYAEDQPDTARQTLHDLSYIKDTEFTTQNIAGGCRVLGVWQE